MERCKLVCSEELLNKLISQCIIEPQGNREFVLYTKKNLVGESQAIEIICDVEVDEDSSFITKIVENSEKSLDEWYNLIRKEFPTNASKHLNEDGRNLRTGVKSKIKNRIQTLIDESFNLNAVIEAIRYEIWFRIKTSTQGNNKLEFMPGLVTWLNDTTNIEAMIERSINSEQFKIENNMNGTGTVKRKIKFG